MNDNASAVPNDDGLPELTITANAIDWKLWGLLLVIALVALRK